VIQEFYEISKFEFEAIETIFRYTDKVHVYVHQIEPTSYIWEEK